MATPATGGRGTVVLVDGAGRVLGRAPKLRAHEAPGMLHLAFSVVLYDAQGRVLLQQRAAGKYHFPSYWANACCSHPGPGEDIGASARQRVSEELGTMAELSPAGSFLYRARCPSSGLVEHELDHVFVGTLSGQLEPDPDEVARVAWHDPSAVLSGAVEGRLVPWLTEALILAERARGA